MSGQFRCNGVGQNSQRAPYGKNRFHLSVLSVQVGNPIVWAFLTGTDDVTNLIIWTAAEISSLIMAASVPFIRLFVKGKLSTAQSYSSGAQGLVEQSQVETVSSSIPTTVGSSRPAWRAQSGNSDLLVEGPPETPEDDGAPCPYP